MWANSICWCWNLTNFVVYTYQSSWLQCLKHQGRSHCDPKLSWNKERNHIVKVKRKQECIPVGCVPSATVAVCWGRGVSARRGMCAPPREQNYRRLWKHYLAATTLRTVKTALLVHSKNVYYERRTSSVHYTFEKISPGLFFAVIGTRMIAIHSFTSSIWVI